MTGCRAMGLSGTAAARREAGPMRDSRPRWKSAMSPQRSFGTSNWYLEKAPPPPPPQPPVLSAAAAAAAVAAASSIEAKASCRLREKA